MTNPTGSEKLVAVERQDREIAAWASYSPCIVDHAPAYDRTRTVQAIAKARLAEREACAKVAESYVGSISNVISATASEISTAIRSRSLPQHDTQENP